MSFTASLRNRATPLLHHPPMAQHTHSTPVATADAPEQLTLLPASERPLQLRLDRRTRELGLAQIALIRRQLAQRAAHTANTSHQAA